MSRQKLHNPGRSIRLQLGSIEVEAFSISGLSTYVAVPSFDAVFDLGHCTVEAAQLRHVVLSHVHQDHCLGVFRHLSLRYMTGQKMPKVYLPNESRAAFIDVIRAFERLEEKQDLLDLDSFVVGIDAGQEFKLGAQRTVRAFDVKHRIASRGYTVFETRRKLKEQYQGLPGEEIKAAHLRGEDLYDRRTVNVLTYVGDSTIETLELHPELGQSEILFLEATHLPGTPREQSAKYGHTHLDELIELYTRSPRTLANPHIVLKHFSMKYDPQQIIEAKRALPEELRARVHFLIPSESMPRT